MAEQGALGHSSLNVVIAGGGGIAQALAQQLLQDYPVERLFLLQRGQTAPADQRVQNIPLDATDPASIAAAGSTVAGEVDRVHLLLNTVGVLHDDRVQPEKRLKDVTAESLHHLMQANAFLLPQLAQAFSSLLRHSEASIVGSLSARVGSITDNDLGGWYSYRASKAAHNQLLRTLAREWRISHKHCCVVALHPGTVATKLSEPYTPANYSRRVLSPQECAQALLDVLSNIGAKESGSFLAWDGTPIPW